jgi:hypothetical protein
METYKEKMEAAFGVGTCVAMKIRGKGVVRVV